MVDLWYNYYSKRKVVGIMTNQEIKLCWERAEQMAVRIWEAYVTGVGVEQAKKDQKNLAVWLRSVRENNIVYNGCYDEYVTLKL